MELTRHYKTILHFFCLIGLVYQLISIIEEYFQYKTSSRVDLQTGKEFDMNQAFVFCSKFDQLMDDNLSPDNVLKMSLKDIFKQTLSINDTINECSIRTNDYGLTSYSSNECYQHFQVIKYFTQELICFEFMRKKRENPFNCDEVPLSLFNRSILHSISLNSSLSRINNFFLVSFYPSFSEIDWENLPFISRRYGHEIRDRKANLFFLSNNFLKINNLPAPFESKCTQKWSESKFYCTMTCNINIYRKFDRTPPNEMVLKPNEHDKLFTIKDVNDKDLIEKISYELNLCRKHCTRELCNDYFSVTQVQEFNEQTTNIIKLSATCSSSPLHRVTFIPNIQLFELLIYVGSSLGMWFGFSVSSVDLNVFSRLTKCNKIDAVSHRLVRERTFSTRTHLKSRSINQ